MLAMSEVVGWLCTDVYRGVWKVAGKLKQQWQAGMWCVRCALGASGGRGTRHKCVAERQKPVSEQRGAAQCLHCMKWFKSRGGLA